MNAATAKLFKNGRSQAVRLPKQFRFPGDEVYVTRQGEKVILAPKPPHQQVSWKAFCESLPKLPDSFGTIRPGNKPFKLRNSLK